MGKRHVKRKTTKPEVQRKKLGQVHSLNGKLWDTWLAFVLANADPKYSAALFLTGALCLRISQASQLRVEHVQGKRLWLLGVSNPYATWYMEVVAQDSDT